MEQVVHARQAHRLAELGFEDALEVAAPQRAHPVGIGRPVEHPLLERLLLVGREDRRPAAAGLDLQALQAGVAVGVAPALREAAGPADPLGDLRGGEPVDGQQDTPSPVAGLGVGFGTDPFGQCDQVIVVVGGDVDGVPPCG